MKLCLYVSSDFVANKEEQKNINLWTIDIIIVKLRVVYTKLIAKFTPYLVFSAKVYQESCVVMCGLEIIDQLHFMSYIKCFDCF